ncbi:MAG: TIM barrel protein [Faecalibacterium sp.]
MTGLTSISYRPHSVEEIIALAVKCGLTGIEWGGDVHVPAGDVIIATAVAAQTKAAGLRVLSYGSYYKLGQQQGTQAIAAAFAPVLASAMALGAPLIRIWAGGCGSATCAEVMRAEWVTELKQVCALAAEQGLKVGLEYHRNTLTDCHQSAACLLEAAACDNLYTYWQMNPDLPFETHLVEIAALKHAICGVHVFHWVKGDVRETLAEHIPEWNAYLAALKGLEIPYILEFVKDDTFAQGEVEAASLKALLAQAK